MKKQPSKGNLQGQLYSQKILMCFGELMVSRKYNLKL